jgi:hypothetical protein
LTGKSHVESLAAHAVKNLEGRISVLWSVVEDLNAGTPERRTQGFATLLPELQRHINAFGLSMRTALTELGYDRSKTIGVGVGVPAHLENNPLLISDGKAVVAVASRDALSTELSLTSATNDVKGYTWFARDGVGVAETSRVSVPVIRRVVPWSRIISDAGVEKVAQQTKDIEIAGAGRFLAAYQLSGDELGLVERMLGVLEAELTKAKANLVWLRGSESLAAPCLQQLSDSLLVCQQNSASGLNAAETGPALTSAGLDVDLTERPISWSDLLRAAAPGDCFLLEGQGHAMTFGRLSDGRPFVYDSEGILGDRENPCLRLVAPGEDADIDRHYGVFQATHRVHPRSRSQTIAPTPSA